jgi:hypothetical protein
MSLYTLLLQLQCATLHLLPVTAAVLHYCYHCCCITYKLLCDGVVAVVLYCGLSSRHNILALDSVLAHVAIEADLCLASVTNSRMSIIVCWLHSDMSHIEDYV